MVIYFMEGIVGRTFSVELFKQGICAGFLSWAFYVEHNRRGIIGRA